MLRKLSSRSIDVSGVRFGHCIGIRFLDRWDHRGFAVWEWLCDACGNKFERASLLVRRANAKSGVASCGCQKIITAAENGRKGTTHGMSAGPTKKLYDVHRQMVRRCTNPESKDWSRYGGRGITIFEEWMDVRAFVEWAMGSGYKENVTIERIDFNGNYNPENCTWILNEKQSHNTSRNKFLTFQGETHHVMDWSRITGIHFQTILRRMRVGWTTKDVLMKKPIRGRNQFSA